MLSLDLIARSLRLPSEVIEVAETLIGRCDQGQKKMEGIWGASLLIAWKIVKVKDNWQNAAKLNKIDVARASQVSERTISSRLRDLDQVLTEQERQWFSS